MEKENYIINSCRVCRTSNRDGDSECLYKDLEEPELTAAGLLYEELFCIKIDRETVSLYPQYLCNSCYLQMKLFKRLRTKASQTHLALRLKYMQNKAFDSYTESDTDQQLKTEDNLEIEIETLQRFNEITCLEKNEENKSLEREEDNEEQEHHNYEEIEENNFDHLKVTDIIEILNPENEMDQCGSGIDLCAASDSSSFQMELPKCQELTDMKSGIVEQDFVEVLDENFEQLTPSISDGNEVFTDVHYLDDDYTIWLEDPSINDLLKENMNKPDRRNFCRKCQQQFNDRTDFLKHKREMHSIKYTCAVCSKVFQTADAHNVHYKLHLGQLAYKCELCGKSFNQKVHYNYHMAKHNNIRNFKCETCAKSFIAKGDLSIHMRTHTGERRYACDICHKEFLLMVHLKNHRYSHFEKKFQCKICQQKFVSPSTLRTHMQSIHENEPRFQCCYCIKKFRRKHHLIAHYKVHRKNNIEEEYVETGIEEIDDPTYLNVND